MSRTLDNPEGSTDQNVGSAGLPLATTVGPSDYYSAMNAYLNKGYTGAQAVAMAANGGWNNIPASAATYAKTPVAAQSVALPAGQSVGQPAASSSGNPWENPAVTGFTPDLSNIQAMLQNAQIIAQHNTGAVNPSDLSYWQNAINSDNGAHNAQYWYDRMEGMGAGGNDISPFGPYAGGQGYQQPAPTASTSPAVSNTGSLDFGSILNHVLGSPIIPQTGTGAQPPIDPKQLSDSLFGLINNAGNFNQDIVNRQTEAAGEQLNRFRQQQEQNDQSALAARGLVNSGPEITAENRLNQNVADQYSQAVQQIYGNESQNADQRMIQALNMASTLAGGNVNQLLQQYAQQANTGLGLGNLVNNNTLGLGNLALGNLATENNYNLGVGQLGAEADAAQTNQLQTLMQNLEMMILQGQLGGAQTAQNGFY